MKSLGRNATREELKAMIAEVDDDGSGEIEFDEFLRLMTSKINDGDTVEEMREAFLVFDRDRSGSVTASELKHVMNNFGETVTDEEVEAMIQQADADGDGELSFEDFYQFIKSKGMI
jgi:calmodulin